MSSEADPPSAGFNGQRLSKDQPIKVEWATGTRVEPEVPTHSTPLLNEEPVWKLGSPKSESVLRTSLSGMVNRSSSKLPSPPYQNDHHSSLSTTISQSTISGEDVHSSTMPSQPVEIGDNSPAEDQKDYPFRRRELP